MRIALHETGEVGTRAGRILLAEARLDLLGLMHRRPGSRSESRVRVVEDLGGCEVLVSDSVGDAERHAEAALDAGISCVLWHDADGLGDRFGDAFRSAGRTLLVGANVACGLAPCLASHEAARSEEVLDVMVAWTEPGRPRRRGEPIVFPEPVGALWARERSDGGDTRRFVAPIDGEWAGAVAKVTAANREAVVSRIVGVADLAPHLEALALAAGALAISEYGYGAARPEDRAEDYLAAALDAGLDVAAYSIET